ncbi:MAG TPA: hypothetical protein VHV47_09220 [Opitutaceae bacterium]|jgi:hypothetical protein|nr:hypothetical protein [Opitutaceae bacterium]
MKRPFLALLAAGALMGGLSACAIATPYQPLNPADASAGGYHDVKLDSNHWRVSFSGNTVTSRETVERYLLYRAAELTAAQGFDWFQQSDTHTNQTTEVYGPPAYYGFGYGYGWSPSWRFHRARFRGGFAGGFYGGWGAGFGDPFGPGFVEQWDRFDVSSEIMMGHGPKPAQALEAREVIANLGPGILRPGQPAPPARPPASAAPPAPPQRS